MSIFAASTRPRPTSVSVIGWLFIGFGALAVFGGVSGMIVSFLVPLDEPAAKMADAPLPFQLVARVVRCFPMLTPIQAAAGALMIWSGAAFLRLRRWARTAIEVLTWMGLLYALAFGAFWLWMVATLWSGAPRGSDDALDVFFPVFLALGGLMIIVQVVLLGAILRVLRGATVRAALDPI